MIPTSPAETIQNAIYQTLAVDAELTGTLGFAVVDDTDRAVYPYVSIGEGDENPDNAHGEFGRAVVETLHIWSAEKGFKQANRALARIVELIDHQPLNLTGHRAVSVRFTNAMRMRDPREEFVRHIAAQFRIVTAQNT